MEEHDQLQSSETRHGDGQEGRHAALTGGERKEGYADGKRKKKPVQEGREGRESATEAESPVCLVPCSFDGNRHAKGEKEIVWRKTARHAEHANPSRLTPTPRLSVGRHTALT